MGSPSSKSSTETSPSIWRRSKPTRAAWWSFVTRCEKIAASHGLRFRVREASSFAGRLLGCAASGRWDGGAVAATGYNSRSMGASYMVYVDESGDEGLHPGN